MAASNTSSPATLFKNRSWSPDLHRDKQWETLKLKHRRRRLLRRSMSVDAAVDEFDVTDDDIKELRACVELGFLLDPMSEFDPKLKRVFPALELYAAVNRQFGDISRCSSMESECSSGSDASSGFLVDPNDDPIRVKMRLKRWAQVVACSIHGAFAQPMIEFAE